MKGTKRKIPRFSFLTFPLFSLVNCVISLFSPFDAILITAGLEKGAPPVLFEQLKKGGVLVAPIGKGENKEMTQFTKLKSGKVKKEKRGIFRFVPFIEEPN